MMRRLDHDLSRWDAGEISLEEVVRRHPDAPVSALTGLHARLTRLTEAPSPDAEPAWTALSARLPAGTAVPRSRRLRRPVVVAVLASILAIPTVSYAAAPDAVRSVARSVADLLPGVGDRPPPEGVDDGMPPTTLTSPTTPTVSEPGVEDHDADEQGPASSPGPGTSTDLDEGTDGSEEGGDPDATPGDVADDSTQVQSTDGDDHPSSGTDDDSTSDDDPTTTEPESSGSAAADD